MIFVSWCLRGPKELDRMNGIDRIAEGRGRGKTPDEPTDRQALEEFCCIKVIERL
jgi:hypothetical protein